ncbi:MAG: hypothetical protein ACREBG_09770, partial [Pyrinomonadaceae bacterium]
GLQTGGAEFVVPQTLVDLVGVQWAAAISTPGTGVVPHNFRMSPFYPTVKHKICYTLTHIS